MRSRKPANVSRPQTFDSQYVLFQTKVFFIVTLKSVGHFITVLVNSLDIHHDAVRPNGVLNGAFTTTSEDRRLVVDVLNIHNYQ